MTWRSAITLQTRQQQVRMALAGAVVGLSNEVAEHRPVTQQLSVAELVAHLVLSEQRVVSDLHLMLQQDWPELPSIQPLEEPARLRALVRQAGSLSALLARFDEACAATLALVAMLTEEEEQRGGRSPELGNVLLGSHAVINMLYHALGHVEEIRVVRQQLGLGSGHLIAGQPGWAAL